MVPASLSRRPRSLNPSAERAPHTRGDRERRGVGLVVEPGPVGASLLNATAVAVSPRIAALTPLNSLRAQFSASAFPGKEPSSFGPATWYHEECA